MSITRRSTAWLSNCWAPLGPHCIAAVLIVVALNTRAAATTADDICPSANPCTVSTEIAVTDGSTLDFGTRSLVVNAGGVLRVDAGTMIITAQSIRVAQGGEIQANGRSQPGGQVTISADALTNIGTISADGTAGGVINLSAQTFANVGTIKADGNVGGNIIIMVPGEFLNGGAISANGNNPAGGGGNIELSGGILTVAGDISTRGQGDSLGGCVTLAADADLELVGTIRVVGGDGGEISATAGRVGGDLVIASGAQLLASGTGTNGGSGGIIELSARGDGVDTGHVLLNGTVQARAGTLQGGDGGCITVTAAGDIIGAPSTNGNDGLNVNSGTPDGFAGEISLAAARDIALQTELSAQGTGSEGVGGDVEVAAGRDLLLDDNARISVAGPGDGGSIDLSATEGELMIKSSSVDASGTFGGDGGDLRIRASGMQGSIVIGGAILASGAGRGGTIEVSAGNTLTLLGPATLTGPRLQALGGIGGAITLRTLRGDLQVAGRVFARGSVSGGGMISAVSASELGIVGELDVDGNARGGDINLEANGTISIDGSVMASGAVDGVGGRITVVGAGAVTNRGELRADGPVATLPSGGNVVVRACDTSLLAGSITSARGTGGFNRIIGRRQITISGSLTAELGSGSNELIYRNSGAPPIILGGASIVPSAVLTLDPTLAGCAVCGDTQIEPPETCDDGNQEDGDGCSSTCQVEAVPCDVDGDGEVDINDMRWLEGELFDGDGDRTLDVGGGAIPSSVGADANEDGRVTGADLSQCIEVLVPE